MNRLDDLLIERITSPLAGWLQHRLDLAPWRASFECLNGSVVFYLGAVALQLAGTGPYDGAFVIMLRALAWLLVLEAVRRHAYRQAASSVGTRTARVREWLFRIVLTARVPISLSYADGLDNLLYSASLLLLVGHLYLKASDAPPPEPKGRFAFNRAS